MGGAHLLNILAEHRLEALDQALAVFLSGFAGLLFSVVGIVQIEAAASDILK